MTRMLKERELFIYSCVYAARKDFCVHFQFGFGKNKTKHCCMSIFFNCSSKRI